MVIDLDNLSISELEQLKVEIDRRVVQLRESALAQARADIERIAASTGYSLDELFGQEKAPARKGVAKKVAADKYRNPQDAKQSWSGRGKRPRWLQALLDEGARLDDFLVA